MDNPGVVKFSNMLRNVQVKTQYSGSNSNIDNNRIVSA